MGKMSELDLMDREIAILQGSYLAKNFPDVWFAQRAREEQGLKTAMQKMNDELYQKFLKIQERKTTR